MDIQKMMDAISESSRRERSNYHATFGDLIEKLKNAPEGAEFSPKIVGIGAYRGYYSDIALCTESTGATAWKTEYDYDSEYSNEKYDKWRKESEVTIEFSKNPHELSKELESIVGMYFDGYKGGYNKITLDKPLWLAADYGDCSSTAVIEITDDLKLITKTTD